MDRAPEKMTREQEAGSGEEMADGSLVGLHASNTISTEPDDKVPIPSTKTTSIAKKVGNPEPATGMKRKRSGSPTDTMARKRTRSPETADCFRKQNQIDWALAEVEREQARRNHPNLVRKRGKDAMLSQQSTVSPASLQVTPQPSVSPDIAPLKSHGNRLPYLFDQLVNKPNRSYARSFSPSTPASHSPSCQNARSVSLAEIAREKLEAYTGQPVEEHRKLIQSAEYWKTEALHYGQIVQEREDQLTDAIGYWREVALHRQRMAWVYLPQSHNYFRRHVFGPKYWTIETKHFRALLDVSMMQKPRDNETKGSSDAKPDKTTCETDWELSNRIS